MISKSYTSETPFNMDLSNHVLVFDIDNTLYKDCTETKLKRRMAIYQNIKDSLNIDFETFCNLSETYTHQYGVNMLGFINDYNISGDGIEALNTYFCEMDGVIAENERMTKLLRDIPFMVFTVTNGNLKQSTSSLKALGLDGIVQGNVCVEYVPGRSTVCKPHEKSFKAADWLIRNGNKDVNVIFFDDVAANITGSESVGWKGVHVEEQENIFQYVVDALKMFAGFEYIE